MSTRRRIETAEQIWNAAIADTPIDDSGPKYVSDEPSPEVWTRFLIALAAFALLEAAIHAAGVMWFLSRFGN